MAIQSLRVIQRFSSSALLVLTALLGGCGGGGGGSVSPSPPPGPAPAPTTVTVNGRITFDRIPFDATLGTGLNPSAPVESPARGIVVEALNGAAVVASATTNSTGDYSLSVPSNSQLFIRAKAQMLKTGTAPTWNFRVLNNTNGDALYVLDGSTFNSGTSNSSRNLRASAGWNGSSYGVRAAAPFAVLDSIYEAASLVISAAPSTAFEPLDLFWSANNRPNTRDQAGNPVQCIDGGDIQTTFYTAGGDPSEPDECGSQIAAGIYILGAMQSASSGDTDEFDQHVIAHEFGHYVEDKFSRSDSMGGEHGDGQLLDLRVAFGEGWGNAFAAMVFDDPIYRDSFNGMASDFVIDLEQDDSRVEGWFSEASVGEILWDLFDATNESADSVTLGFGPIFSAMTEGQRATSAFTSIFSFLEALRHQSPGQAGGIAQLQDGESFSGSGEFGAGETNSGNDATVLPLYSSISLNQGPQLVCVSAANGKYNGLGYRKYFRLDLQSNASVTIDVFGTVGGSGTASAVDPDAYVYREGSLEAFGASTVVGRETISQQSLQAGTYVIDLYDFDLSQGDAPRCMTISVTGS